MTASHNSALFSMDGCCPVDVGWANVVTDEAAIEACPELATLFAKHFWPTPPEWKDLVLNWLSPIPR
jgi:hypothetical protein